VFRFALREPSSYTILVVDDEVDNQTYLRRVLATQGFTGVETSFDAEEMLEKVEQIDVDLIVLDLHLAGRDGFSVLEELRRRKNGDFVPVIVVTSDPDPRVRQRSLALGACDFVARPFERDELLLRLRNLLEQRDIHVQIARANRVLEEQVQLTSSELHQAHADMLVRLARAAEYRDDQTGTHTWRVGYASRLIAQELRAEPRFADLIGLAARLHDVGKIGIPDSVLLKPGRLDAAEFELMKAHSTIGANLLAGSTSPLMQLAESVALNHHERWNGNGYPNGLAFDDIPIEGRIVAVADVFDALTHSRTYKECWSEAEAIAEIRAQKGKQFDPAAVDAFDGIYRNGGVSDIRVSASEDDEVARAALAAALGRPAPHR